MNPRDQFINDALVRVFNGIVRIEESELKKSNFSNLTLKEVHAIHAISLQGNLTASQVAKKLHLTPATLTATIDRLSKKGYVKRVRSQNDRRVVKLYLTDKGRILDRAHEAFHRMMVKNFLMDLGDSEINTIEKALRNLEEFLDEHS